MSEKQLDLFPPKAKRNTETVPFEKITNKAMFRRALTIDNLEHNMLIHGYLRALHDYIFDFGLENTAAYLISRSGICKEDFIRCQLETEWENERMIAIIERAFTVNPTEEKERLEDQRAADGFSSESRIKRLLSRALSIWDYTGEMGPFLPPALWIRR